MIEIEMAYLYVLLVLWVTIAFCENETHRTILNDVGLPPVSAWSHLFPKIKSHPTLPLIKGPSSWRAAVFPNPCELGQDFIPPIYEITKIDIEIYYPGLVVLPEYDMNVTIRDISNDYALICTLEGYTPGPCRVEGDVDTDPATARFVLQQSSLDWSEPKPLRSGMSLSQVWICDRENPGPFPYIYEAYGQTIIETDCEPASSAEQGQHDPCNPTTELPVIIEAVWRTPHNDTRLTPNPISVPEQPPPPARPGRTEDCTANAFSNPDIIVDDFHFVPPPTNKEATSDTLNFTLTSVVTKVRAFCVPTPEQDERYPTRIINTHCINEDKDEDEDDPFQSNTEFYDVEFLWERRDFNARQRFLCGDPEGKRETKFDISAGGLLPYVCPGEDETSTECISARTKFNGTIHAPIENLVPAPVPPPPHTLAPECTQRSLQFTHFIARKIFFYHLYFTMNPAVHNPWVSDDTWEDISLAVEIQNPANEYTATCVIKGGDQGEAEWEDDRWYPCFEPAAKHTFPKYSIETWVQFDSITKAFSLNQTWYCDDRDGPMEFVAKGRHFFSGWQCGWMNITQDEVICPVIPSPIGIPPPTTCKPEYDIQWCNLTNYSPAEVTIRAPLQSQVHLPPNAFDDPDPDPYPEVYSCTVAALSQPIELVLNDFHAQTFFSGGKYRPNDTYTSVMFRLDNSALVSRPGGGSIEVAVGGADLTPYFGAFNPVEAEGRGSDWVWERKFLNDLGWSLRVDLARQYMELSQSWYCEDKDPQHPILFNATWNGYLSLSCAHRGPEMGVDEAIECILAGDEPTLKLLPSVTAKVQQEIIPDPMCSGQSPCPYPRVPNATDGEVILS
ncbi:hypothetical protein F4808DRAFT_287369 [Astrocystis sublimbata]|nr:hypothetical protein F4808DRAFT_287369 [Astrocystis sublimbata]